MSNTLIKYTDLENEKNSYKVRLSLYDDKPHFLNSK